MLYTLGFILLAGIFMLLFGSLGRKQAERVAGLRLLLMGGVLLLISGGLCTAGFYKDVFSL